MLQEPALLKKGFFSLPGCTRETAVPGRDGAALAHCLILGQHRGGPDRPPRTGTARGLVALPRLLGNGIIPVENLAPSHEHYPGKLADIVENHVVILDAVRHASDVGMR